jgi:hypothetical protein
MCLRRSRHWEERVDETREERPRDLFSRETERSEPPVPVAKRDQGRESERERDKVPAGAE